MPDAQPSQTLADKLNYLFRTVRTKDPKTERPREFSNAEVAEATGLSDTYIGYLRKGIRDNPTRQHMQALAKHFGVPTAYLADDDLPAQRVSDIEAQLGLVHALADAGVAEVALRAHGLSTKGLDALRVMVEQMREFENLPPVPESPQRGPDKRR